MKITRWGAWDFKDRTFMYTQEEEQAVINALKEKGYIFSGEYHQNGNFGVPYFDNGKPYQVSMRHWGKIIAEARPDIVDLVLKKKQIYTPLNLVDYCFFAWDEPYCNEYYVYPTEGE